MSRRVSTFLGAVSGNRQRRTEKVGSAKSGIEVWATGQKGGVRVMGFVDPVTGQEIFYIDGTPGQGDVENLPYAIGKVVNGFFFAA